MSFRMVHSALEASDNSNFDKSRRMGCVAYLKKKPVVYGFNSKIGSGKATLHAEQHVIEQLARRHRLLPNLRKLLMMYETPDVPTKTISHCRLPPYEIQPYRKDRTLQPFGGKTAPGRKFGMF